MRFIVKSLIFLSILQLKNPLKAQESILSDISYLYMEKLVAVAKENYPKNKSLESRIKIAENNISMAKTSWLEPFNASYVYRSNTNAVDIISTSILSGYLVSVTFSPSSLFKKPFEVKNSKEELKIIKTEKDEYAIQLETEVKKRYITYLQSYNTLKLITKRMLDTEASFLHLKSRYERSEISFEDYNGASLALTSSQEAKINAEASYITAKLTLEELLTKKLEEIK